jgi:hypothetical protein
VNYVSIIPKPIGAAGSTSFDAIGCRDMWIDVPTGNGEFGKVMLKNVLYTPNVGLTLISIS